MKILHLVHQYLPEQVGGTEFYTNWVAHRLAQRGHQVDIFYRRYVDGAGSDSRFDGDGVRVWASWSGNLSPNRRFLATFHEKNILGTFRRVVQVVQPELVHIQHLMGLPVALVNHLRQCHIPFIITLHDYWWICANAQLLTNYSQELCDGPHRYLNCARCALARAGHPKLWPAVPALAGSLAWRNHLLRQAMNAAHKLITPSRFARDWHAAHGVHAHKLQVIPHGLDLPSHHLRQPQEQRALLRIAYIGGLSWQKGIHILVEAFRELEAGAELWIAGDETTDPTYVSNLRALAPPQVRFLGRLTRESVWDTLAQVDVVVVPTLWYETFSFIVSEAFAAGVPVVASRLGPLVDRVSDEVDGLLVPPGDPQALRRALLRFWQEPDLLARLRAGIRPIRTLDDHVTELESVYKTAV
jgi:glycosyltransferase involved in cell wall biosynthesis